MSCSCHHNQPASCHHLNNHTGHTVLRHWRVKIERRLWCCHRKQEARSASEQSDNQGAVSASNFVSKPSWAELRMAVEVMMIGAGVTTFTADCQYWHPPLQPPLLPDLAIRILSSCLSWILMMETPSIALQCPPHQSQIPPQLFWYLQFSILKLRQFLNFLHIIWSTFFTAKCRKYFHKPLNWFISELWSGLASHGVWRISCVRLHKDFMLILLRRLRTSNTPVHFLNSKLLLVNVRPKNFEKIPHN